MRIAVVGRPRMPGHAGEEPPESVLNDMMAFLKVFPSLFSPPTTVRKQNYLLYVLDWNLQTPTDTFTAAASQNSQ